MWRGGGAGEKWPLDWLPDQQQQQQQRTLDKLPA